jgi:GNAT superfamily N-acetyltransferase
MESELSLVVFDDHATRPAALAVLGQHLSAYHRFSAGDDFRELFVLLWRGQDKLVGGLIGGTHCGWLNVEFVWVDELARRHGFGSRLLAAAEAEAVARGCRQAYIDTAASDTADFFRRRGFRICGELSGFVSGRSRYWMHKMLSKDTVSSIAPLDADQDDDLIDNLLEHNREFQELVRRSEASPRMPFVPRG